MANEIHVKLGEQTQRLPAGTTLFQLRARHKPDADIVVFNGAPVEDDRPLADGDAVVLIQRGEIPPAETLEALMAARHSPGVHATLKRATVGIAGLGGLGSAVAVALARSGVGTLVLADFDVVEPSNLNRQQYLVKQIGMKKTDALRDNLLGVNPYIQIEIHCVRLEPHNIPNIFPHVEVLIEAFDSAEGKAMLAESFATAFPSIPLILASGVAGHLPGNTIRTRKIGRNMFLVGDGEAEAKPGTGLMAPRVGIAAHQQANAAIRILLNEDPVD